MNIRGQMVKERREILDRMDDQTLLKNIEEYFKQNATAPGEKALKDEAAGYLKSFRAIEDDPNFNPNVELPWNIREDFLDEFAEVCIKSTKLKNAHSVYGQVIQDDVFFQKGESEAGKVQYTSTGIVEPPYGNPSMTVNFGKGNMTADLPLSFAKAHPDIVGKSADVEIIDYSNGKWKNVVYNLHADMLKGCEFDRMLASDRYTPNMDVNEFARISEKFDAFVPSSGKADTLGGEMVRAMSRIGYRYLNDGDKINDGYGKDTVNPAARFLLAKGNEKVKDAVEDMWAPGTFLADSDDKYEQKLTNLARALNEQFDQNPDLFHTPNEEDMFDYRTNEDYDDSEDDEEEWYDEYDDEGEYDDEEDYDDFADAVESLDDDEDMEL